MRDVGDWGGGGAEKCVSAGETTPEKKHTHSHTLSREIIGLFLCLVIAALSVISLCLGGKHRLILSSGNILDPAQG